MDNRRAERTRKRLACGIEFDQGRSTGLILDVSATGLFVQTGAKVDPGDSVVLEFEPPGSSEAVRVTARVVRRLAVPARLKSVAQAGIGVEIEQAPEGFFAMIAALQDVAHKPSVGTPAVNPPRRPAPRKTPTPAKTAGPAKAPVEKKPALSRLRKCYKVEVHEIGGKGARIVEVEAMNAAAAGRRALVEVGDGWKVAGCELT